MLASLHILLTQFQVVILARHMHVVLYIRCEFGPVLLFEGRHEKPVKQLCKSYLCRISQINSIAVRPAELISRNRDKTEPLFHYASKLTAFQSGLLNSLYTLNMRSCFKLLPENRGKWADPDMIDVFTASYRELM